jgi:histidine triad (HIT) family protein
MFSHAPKDYQCPLCIFVSGGETDFNKKSDIFFENENVVSFVSPKWWKNNPGNAIVIPRQHVENIF